MDTLSKHASMLHPNGQLMRRRHVIESHIAACSCLAHVGWGIAPGVGMVRALLWGVHHVQSACGLQQAITLLAQLLNLRAAGV